MPITTDQQIVSLHTFKGVQVYQFLPDQYLDCTWGRTQRDPSQFDINLPPDDTTEALPDIAPWLHWLSVWDGDRDVLMWTGPVQKATKNRGGMALNAKDSSAYLARTRNPITKRWDAADPSWIAGELWEYMVAAQNLDARPIVRSDPQGERYDFQVVTDAQMLDKTIDDLVDLQMRWTVVSGVPIIGPLSLKPIATLGENDFIGDGIDLVRDGSGVYNDVLVRGPDNLARAKVDYYGQNLQTISNLDSMFGVSNVERAAQQYLRSTGAVKTKLDVPTGTALHPEAPVSIDDLMPSARFVIEAHGVREMMELTGVSVERRSGSINVKVTMDSLPERDTSGKLIELAQTKNQPTVTLGTQASRQ